MLCGARGGAQQILLHLNSNGVNKPTFAAVCPNRFCIRGVSYYMSDCQKISFVMPANATNATILPCTTNILLKILHLAAPNWDNSIVFPMPHSKNKSNQLETWHVLSYKPPLKYVGGAGQFGWVHGICRHWETYFLTVPRINCEFFGVVEKFGLDLRLTNMTWDFHTLKWLSP